MFLSQWKGARLQTLNSRVRGSNPDSIYSIDWVFPGLGLLHTQQPQPFTVHCTISSVHRMVIEKNFHVVFVIAWCAVVSRETLVKRCIFLWQYLVLLPLPLPDPHDNMLPDHLTAIYLLWDTGKMVDSNSGARTDSSHTRWLSDDSQMNSKKPTRRIH